MDMTDQEINEAVARKLGVIPQVPEELKHIYKIEHKGHIKDYCHSIEAAWEIVEQIGGMGLFLVHDGEDEQWDACDVNETLLARAPTAPMAICLAFLELP